MKSNQVTKLCFLLSLNDKIIVQRFFNVPDYNEDAKNSIELLNFVNGIKYDLEEYLRDKSIDYMSENAMQIMTDPSVMDTSMTDGPEYINIYIKDNDMTICHRRIDAKLYPPKARYTVDVRPYIKDWLSELTDIFSSENLSYEYLGYSTLV